MTNDQKVETKRVPGRSRRPYINTRRGRKRWSDLIKFLKTTMKTSGNERVRMQAADRLAQILAIREEREIAELRVQERMARIQAQNGGGSEPAEDEAPEATEPVESASTAAQRFLDSLKQRKAEGTDTEGTESE